MGATQSYNSNRALSKRTQMERESNKIFRTQMETLERTSERQYNALKRSFAAKVTEIRRIRNELNKKENNAKRTHRRKHSGIMGSRSARETEIRKLKAARNSLLNNVNKEMAKNTPSVKRIQAILRKWSKATKKFTSMVSNM